MKLLRNILLLLFVLVILSVGVLFAIENTATVPLNLLVFHFEAHSIALWVLLAFALGGVLGILANIGVVWRLRARLLRSNRQLQRQSNPSSAQ
jgi:putative membrane protein